MARASRLRLDAAAADLFARFETAGVKTLLLKGPSVAQWLYTDGPPREYLDCDFLVAPRDFVAAEEILASAGYRRVFDDRKMPSWWREHAGAWLRKGDEVTVDLHRTLVGIRVDDAVAWQVLATRPGTVVVQGRELATLGLPARALHVVLHAAQHGAGWAGPMADLQRALAVRDDDLWKEAAALAVERHAGW